LELVSSISKEVALSQGYGVEVGGVLLGSVVEAPVPTLRIEAVEMIPRTAQQGTIFMIGPENYDYLAHVRQRAEAYGRTPVGLFRTHLRTGPLQPSISDRGVLVSQFGTATHVLLLIESLETRNAVFFLSEKGQLPDVPVVPEFRFQEGEWATLPGPRADAKRSAQSQPEGDRSNRRTWAILGILAVIAVAACLLMLSFSGAIGPTSLPGSPVRLQVAPDPSGKIVRITWNHASRPFDRASGANLLIDDAGEQQEVPLAIDDLRLGFVEYEPSSPRLRVTLSLNYSGLPPRTETVDWSANGQ
jgi:hypothetical protein